MHGASTITQQLARNIFLTHEVSIERKLKEIFITLELTKKYSKEDIIEFYVNDICYANGIYGIEGAAKAYFNKDVNDLTLSQIAYLCAIPNQPEYYNPYKDSTRAITRRDKILKDMYSMGYISEKDYKFAIIEEITIEKPKKEFNDYLTSYAIDCTVKYLMQENGFEFKYHFNSNEEKETYDNSYNEAYTLAKNQLYIQGYNIYTSLDPKIYEKLQNILDEELSFSEEKDETTGIYKLQGALTCIDNNTQKVIAVVGGRSQEKEQGVYSFNRAYQSYRQPGSSIKPLIVYTPALENGYTPDTIVQNIDVSKAKEKGIDVQSLTGTMMTLREAVEKSKNGVAWQVFDKITPSKGLSYIEKMKFSNICKDDYNDASALGGLTNGVTTVEMASAYSTLSNHGKYKEPTCLTSIIDKDGTEIYKDSKSIEIYDRVANDKMIDILKGVITRGTASKLNWYSSTDTEAFAKTGTTNGNKDGWLCGSTPYYSIAVWIGYDTPKEMSNLYGSTYPGQIWKKSMLELIKDKDVAKFELSEEELNMSNSDNYYSYLPGRDDEEVLSPGYTVGDFRTDRVIGESIDLIINQINSLDSTISNHGVTLENLYNQGVNIINTLRSTKYKAEMTSKLTEAYNSKKGIQETPNEDVPSQEDTNETIDSNVPQVEEPTTSESSTEVTPPTTETIVPETPSSSETINEPIEQPTETPSNEEPTIDDSLNTTTETQETSLE